MTFASFALDPTILDAVVASGYTEPTPVQLRAIPLALAGGDLLVSAQTGSGKTAAFILPSLQRLLTPSTLPGNGPRILVLAPTRELAAQVLKAATIYGRGLRRLRTAAVTGGASYTVQLRALSQPVDVVVATPGRLLDHLERGRIDLSRVEVLVLDEADRMLDMGFIGDIEAVVARTPASRQTLLFSATLDGMVGNLARRLTRDPQRVDVATTIEADAAIEQRLLYADDLRHKNRLLDHLLRDAELTQALVFTSTKRAADELSETLREQGFSAAALHGDMRQYDRNRTLQGLRDGRTRVLVATDVAARGIDVAGISHVINFDAPKQAEDYVHRIGRTGRAGRSGTAVTLVGSLDRRMVRDIERFTGKPIRVDVIPGLEPTRRERPAASYRAGEGRRPGHPGNRDAGPARTTARTGTRDANSAWTHAHAAGGDSRPRGGGDSRPRGGGYARTGGEGYSGYRTDAGRTDGGHGNGGGRPSDRSFSRTGRPAGRSGR